MGFKRRTTEVNFILWVMLLIISPLMLGYDIGVGILFISISLFLYA